DAEVFDGFALKFFADTLVERVGEPGGVIFFVREFGIGGDGFCDGGCGSWRFGEAIRIGKRDGFGERDEIRGVFVERLQGFFAEAAGGVRTKEMRAAVDGVDGLAFAPGTGVAGGEGGMRLLERSGGLLNCVWGKRPLHGALLSLR